MEIKQGDKVRVSKDAPKMYYPKEQDGIVMEIEGEDAFIKSESSDMPHCSPFWVLAIPTKYLVKVDAEAKEAKIKLGDMVRIKGNLHEPFCLDADLHLEITNIPPHAVSQKEWKVIKVVNRRDCAGHIYTLNNGDSFIHNIPEDCVELIKPTARTIKVGDRVRSKGYALEAVVLGINGDYIAVRRDDGIKQEWKRYMTELVEPTEQTEEDVRIRQIEAELDEFRKAELDRVLHPEKYYTYEVTIDNVAMNWQRYEADLAKELALKVANKFNAPHEAAEYAVKVAKAVVEGLKRK